jgi:hypothetical protein
MPQLEKSHRRQPGTGEEEIIEHDINQNSNNTLQPSERGDGRNSLRKKLI